MRATIELDNQKVSIDLSKPLDISIPIQNTNGVNAWYVDHAKIVPQQLGDWEGSTKRGASVNFNQIQFNPHSHGTHTESVGHILSDALTINEALNNYFFRATLITVQPVVHDNDLQITKDTLIQSLTSAIIGKALIVRTLPNLPEKKTTNYSNSNWAYFTKEAITYLVSQGVKHLLVDTPSVDKEKDDGQLIAHHTFWQTSDSIRTEATITEFIFVPNDIQDGDYLLNLQVAAFDNNAAPSRPLLFKFES